MGLKTTLLWALTAWLGMTSALPAGIRGARAWCESFPLEPKFNESAALGSWQLQHCWKQGQNLCGANHCMNIQLVTPEERKELHDKLGSEYPEMSRDAVTLKMMIPCAGPGAAETGTTYWLEKVTENGFYRGLDIPPQSEKPARPPGRSTLVLVEAGGQLAVLDCIERLALQLARAGAPAVTKDVHDARLAALLQALQRHDDD